MNERGVHVQVHSMFSLLRVAPGGIDQDQATTRVPRYRIQALRVMTEVFDFNLPGLAVALVDCFDQPGIGTFGGERR